MRVSLFSMYRRTGWKQRSEAVALMITALFGDMDGRYGRYGRCSGTKTAVLLFHVFDPRSIDYLRR